MEWTGTVMFALMLGEKLIGKWRKMMKTKTLKGKGLFWRKGWEEAKASEFYNGITLEWWETFKKESLLRSPGSTGIREDIALYLVPKEVLQWE
jgi:hypothetical protein